MQIQDDNHLMFIEPKSPHCESIDDELTSLTWDFMSKCKPNNKKFYKGFHTCACGITSDNRDWYTPNGTKTNSLLVHYVRSHRSEVPQTEIDKLVREIETA